MQDIGLRLITAGRLTHLLHGIPLAAALLLSACSSHDQGKACQGTRQTLQGETLGVVEGKVLDRYNNFTVTMPDLVLNSGPLWSADRQQYIPSSVTADGWLAQRISDNQFSIINAPQNQMITFICPLSGK